MARRNDHTREELKEMILKTSSKIVRKEGYAGLTARRIANDIGYVPGTIYNLFDSMDDLIMNVNAATLDRLYTALSSSSDASAKTPPIKNIKKMAEQYRIFAKDNKNHWLMLFTYSLPEGTEAPDWYREKIARLFEPLENLLQPFFSEKQARTRKTAARILWASVHGLCFLEETGKIPLIDRESALPDMTAQMIDTFMAGLEKTA